MKSIIDLPSMLPVQYCELPAPRYSIHYDEAYEIAAETLLRAIDDLSLPEESPDNSSKWFISNLTTPYSFLWICFHLNLSPTKIRRHYYNKIYLQFIRRINGNFQNPIQEKSQATTYAAVN